MLQRMYLTDEDREILLYVESFGSITITQAQNMYYNRQKGGYEMARRHCKKLVNYERLNCFRDEAFNRNVYYIDKKPSYHTILIMDYYTALLKAGATIKYFKREQQWLNKKYYSDGYCVYSIGQKVYFDLLEVVRTKQIEVKKYKEIYESHEAHDLSHQIVNEITGQKGGKGELFPRLVIIDDIKHKDTLDIAPDVNMIQLDFNLSNIMQLFI